MQDHLNQRPFSRFQLFLLCLNYKISQRYFPVWIGSCIWLNFFYNILNKLNAKFLFKFFGNCNSWFKMPALYIFKITIFFIYSLGYNCHWQTKFIPSTMNNLGKVLNYFLSFFSRSRNNFLLLLLFCEFIN